MRCTAGCEANFARVGGRAVVFADVNDGHRLAWVMDETAHVELIDRDDDDIMDAVVIADDLPAFFELLTTRVAGAPWRVIGSAYERLSPWSPILRPAVEHPQSRPLTDLSPREVRTLLYKLAHALGTDDELRWWWDCLTTTHDVRVDFEDVFRRLGIFKRKRTIDDLRTLLHLPPDTDDDVD